MLIRPERLEDHAPIRAVTVAAFQSSAYGHNGEADLVDALREAGVLTVSLAAVEAGEVVGHVAFSPVRIADAEGDWFGLAPLSVAPAWQGRGVGQALAREGLRAIGTLGAAGCVVVGDPGYYGRFGFANDPALTWGEHSAYLHRLVLRGRPPRGEVQYHPAFGA